MWKKKSIRKALVMEERLCVAAARMGEHTAEEMKKGHGKRSASGEGTVVVKDQQIDVSK